MQSDEAVIPRNKKETENAVVVHALSPAPAPVHVESGDEEKQQEQDEWIPNRHEKEEVSQSISGVVTEEAVREVPQAPQRRPLTPVVASSKVVAPPSELRHLSSPYLDEPDFQQSVVERRKKRQRFLRRRRCRFMSLFVLIFVIAAIAIGYVVHFYKQIDTSPTINEKEQSIATTITSDENVDKGAVNSASTNNADNNDSSDNSAIITTMSIETQVKDILKELSSLEDMERKDSPQNKAFLWMMEDVEYNEYFLSGRMSSSTHTTNIYSLETMKERYIMATLYFSTRGPQWTWKGSFMNHTKSICEWGNQDHTAKFQREIVSCHDNLETMDSDDEEHDNLSNSNNSTTSETIHLNLAINNLDGTIPTELGGLVRMENIRLSNNKLTGNIPTTLGNLKNLKQLWLNNNRLDGTIPTQFGSLATNKFELLSLYGNKMMNNIPTELGQLTSLKYLWLHQNPSLSGSIPTAHFYNLKQLQYLFTRDVGLWRC